MGALMTECQGMNRLPSVFTNFFLLVVFTSVAGLAGEGDEQPPPVREKFDPLAASLADIQANPDWYEARVAVAPGMERYGGSIVFELVNRSEKRLHVESPGAGDSEIHLASSDGKKKIVLALQCADSTDLLTEGFIPPGHSRVFVVSLKQVAVWIKVYDGEPTEGEIWSLSWRPFGKEGKESDAMPYRYVEYRDKNNDPDKKTGLYGRFEHRGELVLSNQEVHIAPLFKDGVAVEAEAP